jgi:ATP-binding cassette subfamily B protein
MTLKNKSKKSYASSAASLRRVFFSIGKHKYLLILSAAAACISQGMQLYIPMLFGNAIDAMIGQGKVDFALIGSTLTLILALVILSSAAVYLMNLLNNRITYKTAEDLRNKAIRKIHTLPLKYLDGHSTGDIVDRVIADVDQLSDGLLLGFTQFFSGIAAIAMTLIFMFSRNVWITLLVIALTPISFAAAGFITSHTYKMFQKQSALRGKETAYINEMVGSEKTVKAFGYEEQASQKFHEINDDLRECSRKAVFYSSLTNPSTRCINSLIYAAVAVAGALMILNQSLTVGGLSTMLSYASQYTKPFNDISSVISELQNALACADRVFTLLDEKEEPMMTSSVNGDIKGAISFEHVSFRYDENKPLIEDFNLNVHAGMRVALVGPTGCGKTTLINLLMRFYHVRSGMIRIDGQDTSTVSAESLRSCFGMVLQDTWLKETTVRENISFGKQDASDKEIIESAKRAHSWSFIQRLPQGLDTVIDEDTLSQGERQLLCITRVMLALPPILILDEATSSIDTRTELKIQKAFDTLMEGRTSFVVAHRLSTIRDADLILVMNHGTIIEQGTHETLIKENGFYKKLYESQFSEA